MKREYTTPKALPVSMNPSQIVCVSVEDGGNGNGRPAESKGALDFDDDDM